MRKAISRLAVLTAVILTANILSAEEQVLLGREDFLFYSDTLDDYTGKSLSDAELEQAILSMLDECILEGLFCL